uniref:Uncharacterized protein n=1 Tax=Opuntia streptacantha TaxID=393608 RepID=A0A7C9AKN0_OPUST
MLTREPTHLTPGLRTHYRSPKALITHSPTRTQSSIKGLPLILIEVPTYVSATSEKRSLIIQTPHRTRRARPQAMVRSAHWVPPRALTVIARTISRPDNHARRRRKGDVRRDRTAMKVFQRHGVAAESFLLRHCQSLPLSLSLTHSLPLLSDFFT